MGQRASPDPGDGPIGKRLTTVLTVVLVTTAVFLPGIQAEPGEDEELEFFELPTEELEAPIAVGAAGGDPGSPDDRGPKIRGTSCYTGRSAFEPTIGTTLDGTLFMQSSKVVGRVLFRLHESQHVVRSSGGCDDWEQVTPAAASNLGVDVEQTVPPISFDPYVHVDPSGDRVFALNMQGLQCNWLSFSDDLGESWLTNPVACGQQAGLLDHPTIFTGPPGPDAPATDQATLDAVGYPNVVYVCTNRVLTEAACSRSLDGGLTFGPASEFITGLDQAGLFVNGDGCLSGLLAHGTTGPDGIVYIGTTVDWESCVDTGTPAVAISRDSGLTWTLSRIDDAQIVNHHETSTAVDAAGNVYAVWINAIDRRPRLSVSTDNGTTWSAPADFAPSDVNATSFPTVAAGDAGKIAIAYYSTGAEEAGPASGSEVPDGVGWNGTITVSTDADTATPSFETVDVNPADDPIARGPCNTDGDTSGFRCEPPQFGGSVGDFIDVVIDGEGRPWAAMVDVCNGPCVDDPDEGKHGALGFVGTLVKGPKLRGSGQLPALD